MHEHDEHSPQGWDRRYSSAERLWSGRVNAAVAAEAAALHPGRALDVGCGEGADAIWLAGRGWTVTGLDPSRVALDRAVEAARAGGVDVSWIHGKLADRLVAGPMDLVCACYPALPLETDPLQQLVSLVAPGGTLLVVHHADIDVERAKAHGFDPATLLQPADVVRGLGAGWRVVVDEVREREVAEGAGADHHLDHVVRAERLPD
ncbi:MAG: class I SAM-dependent methyltransferase [Actinobacteria bacterium]|nr:class I SAM-dependent methyltransferase [Actinomycetota bacterium]